MILAAVRTMYGVDSDQLSALYFLAYCAAAGGFQTLIEATPKSAQEYKIKVGITFEFDSKKSYRLVSVGVLLLKYDWTRFAVYCVPRTHVPL